MEKEKKRKDVIFAIFLIFIGIIFLFNTTGFIGWGIWNHILRFWPIFLILAGIKLIFENSIVTEMILGILALILFSLVAIFSYISYTSETLPFIPERFSQFVKDNPGWFGEPFGDEIKESQSIDLEKYDDVESRVLDINVGASQFTLTDDPTLDNYIILESKYTEGHITPSLESSLDDGTLDILFKTQSPRRVFFGFGTRTFSPTFDLTLGQTDIKTDLNIQLGAGKGNITLENLSLGSLVSKLGAGKLDLEVSNSAIPEDISIELGAGKMTLTIPEEVGYELSYELGVGQISVNQVSIADFIGEETEFRSENFDEATEIIEIDAKVGVGSFEIYHN